MERSLILVRHGQSIGNQRNIFTGVTDLGLTAQGITEAESVGQMLSEQQMHFDAVFTSALSRAADTAAIILSVTGEASATVRADAALNERDYGMLTGLNKDEARARWGESQIAIWRRSYDVAPPSGESLKDTVGRVLPYYLTEILPAVMRGERTLVVAHGNSLRALIMVLERHSPKTIPTVELVTGQIRSYVLSSDTTACAAAT
jgi:2,3-bisphosphoglycerate-dependent phosphoglycerate mutase